MPPVTGEDDVGADAQPANLHDWEEPARRVLGSDAFDYVAGGGGDEVTLRDNRAAFTRWKILPRVLRPGSGASLATTILGRPAAVPIMVAPFAYQGVLSPEGECDTARAAAAVGSTMCVSTLSNRSLEEIADATGEGDRIFQLYAQNDEGVNAEILARAREAGYRAVIVTVDLPPFGSRDRDTRSGFSIPADLALPNIPPPPGHDGSLTPHDTSFLMNADMGWPDIERIVSQAGVPVVVKGILAPGDAVLAAEHGVAGVIVSNHGGRQLDTVPATIDALEPVVQALEGRAEVWVDGGIRRGTDVLTALALGARAVLVGRPVAWGLAVGAASGVEAVLSTLATEFQTALTLSGVASPDQITREMVFPGPVSG
jgi:isopentenyl diphosphate isomerase/L-lactate dehydrogenase-like FMN-dependent dehydrogenase